MYGLSMPFCASAYQVIQEMTNTTRKSGEQHIEIGLSRIIAIGKIHVLLLNTCIKEIHLIKMFFAILPLVFMHAHQSMVIMLKPLVKAL